MADRRERRLDAGDSTFSRREFLKVTGTIVLVTGTSCRFADTEEASAKAAQTSKHAKLPPSDGYILVDTKKCQGCMSCMLACSLVHEGVESQSLSRIQVIENAFEAFPNDLTIEQCRQCVNPACVEKCPEKALSVNAEQGNVRVVDTQKCIGCGVCFDACPYTPSRAAVAPDRRHEGNPKARKCDLCANAPYHWDEAGGGPDGKQACVAVCPVGAITFTMKIPDQDGDKGYKVNLRSRSWRTLGYPTG
jgi:protein NrfC